MELLLLILVIASLAIFCFFMGRFYMQNIEASYAEDEVAPTKEDLNALKRELGIKTGSIQHKNGSIYHVVYDSTVRKHRWKRLGYYKELSSNVF